MNSKFLSSAKHSRILVIGDLILDRYILGEASRISQEAPVPVVLISNEIVTPGGAANVAANIKALGAECWLIGAIGKDINGEILQNLLVRTYDIKTNLFCCSDRPTTTKTRVVAGIQQVVRLDEENSSRISQDVKINIMRETDKMISEKLVDGIIIEDYAKGLLDGGMVQSIINYAIENNVVVTIDPNPKNKMGLSRFTTMTPNRHEAYSLAGIEENTHNRNVHPLEDDELRSVGDRLLEKYDIHFVIVTLGKDGMIVYGREFDPHHVPTKAIEVFDVSGAGDTVIAAFTTCYAKMKNEENSIIICSEIANAAAGVVVGKRGAATATIKEIKERIKL